MESTPAKNKPTAPSARITSYKPDKNHKIIIENIIKFYRTLKKKAGVRENTLKSQDKKS